MENKTIKSRKLADYIYKDLDQEEITDMEREISADPELSESYRLNMLVKDFLQAKLQLEEMKSDPMLQEAEKLADMAFQGGIQQESSPPTYPESRKRSRIRHFSFAIALAASVALLITLVLPSDPDPNRLFDRYYAPFAASDFTQRGSSDEQVRALARGINLYLEEEYVTSIGVFNTISSDPALGTEAAFFSALSYMGLEQYQDAQYLFESLLLKENRYQLETLWYASLAYVKTGEVDRALSLLGQLEKYNGMYQESARRLCKKLLRIK